METGFAKCASIIEPADVSKIPNSKIQGTGRLILVVSPRAVAYHFINPGGEFLPATAINEILDGIGIDLQVDEEGKPHGRESEAAGAGRTETAGSV